MYLPEVPEDKNGSWYNAAHSNGDQQDHVVNLSVYIDYRGKDKKCDKGLWKEKIHRLYVEEYVETCQKSKTFQKSIIK